MLLLFLFGYTLSGFIKSSLHMFCAYRLNDDDNMLGANSECVKVAEEYEEDVVADGDIRSFWDGVP